MNKESKLSKYKIKYEDSPKKLILSRFAGKQKALVTRAFNKSVSAIKNFFVNLLKALRVIIRGIM